MSSLPKTLEKVIDALSSLPGIGRKSAQRLGMHMIKMDKERIGFKPEKGQNQWTRACQNSGNNKKRRPYQYNDKTLS